MNQILDKVLSNMEIEENNLVEHERRNTTWQERIYINDISFDKHNFLLCVKCIEYGCKSIKGQVLTKDNLEQVLNSLSNNEIYDLGTYIYLDINKLKQDKKKLSKPDSQSEDSSGEHSESEK